MSPGMKSPATPNLQYHHTAPPPNLEFFFSSLIPMQTTPFSVLKSMVSASFASASSSFVSTIPWHSPKRDVDRGRCRGAAVCPSTTPLPALLFCSTVEGRAQSNLPLPRSSTWDYSSRFPTRNLCNPSHCRQTQRPSMHFDGCNLTLWLALLAHLHGFDLSSYLNLQYPETQFRHILEEPTYKQIINSMLVFCIKVLGNRFEEMITFIINWKAGEFIVFFFPISIFLFIHIIGF